MIDIRQSSVYGKYMEQIGWQTEKLGSCQVFLKRIPFFGSLAKIQHFDSLEFDQLDKFVKSNRVFLLSLEPQNEKQIPELLARGFRLAKDTLIPSKTRQINLSPTEQEIFQSFNRTRKYKIGKAKKNGFQVKIENGLPKGHSLAAPRSDSEVERSARGGLAKPDAELAISDFIKLWHKNAFDRGFWVPIEKQIKEMYKTFAENGYLILAYQQKELLAGILLIIDGKTAHYFYAASGPTGRQLCAPSLLAWEAMKLSKKRGCTIFDFEGIYDERFPQKSWSGFSYFKESFGGNVISYPGRFIKKFGPLGLLPF